jgi:predicted ABC-type ATPase
MAAPELWIVAGPNGAGKTTSVQRKPIAGLLPPVRFLNPDDRTLVKLRAAGYRGFADAPLDVQTRLFIESADEVTADLEAAVARGEAVGVETVLSSEKYLPLVEAVVARGGAAGLLYVALSSPEIARERVAARVRRGGHGVPDDKVRQRWQRSLDYLPRFATKAAAFWVVDNSGSDPTVDLPLLASGRHGRLEHLAADAFPEMTAALAAVPRMVAPLPDPT